MLRQNVRCILQQNIRALHSTMAARATLFLGNILSFFHFTHSNEARVRTYILSYDCTFYFRSKFITHSYIGSTHLVYTHPQPYIRTKCTNTCMKQPSTAQRTRAATKKCWHYITRTLTRIRTHSPDMLCV